MSLGTPLEEPIYREEAIKDRWPKWVAEIDRRLGKERLTEQESRAYDAWLMEPRRWQRERDEGQRPAPKKRIRPPRPTTPAPPMTEEQGLRALYQKAANTSLLAIDPDEP